MQRSSLDRFRESLRLQQVYNVFLRYGMDYAFERWSAVDAFRRAMQAWVWQLPEEAVSISAPVRMRLMLEELGPTYVKMGQIISSQSSVLPADWAAELEKLQSNVPPFDGAIVREIVAEELGGPPESVFAHFEPEPFAAASTAQVHRASLPSGESVVVKVQRPDIRSRMRADVGIMLTASRVLSQRSAELKAIDLEGMVREFGKNVLEELDYGNEAYNAMRLGQNMALVPDVGVPRVYGQFSTSKILTMDFVRGVKISNLSAIDEAGLDRQRLARSVLRAVVKQLFIDGFFHADPHPGNILVDPETGRLTFIDLGMVGQLALGDRLNIVQLMLAMKQGDIPGIAQILRSLSVPFIDDVDEKAYYRDFERTFSRYWYGESSVSMGAGVNVMFELLRQHGLRLNPELTMAMKAIVQLDSIATLLYPEGGFVVEGTDMAIEMGLEAITVERMTAAAKDQVAMTARELMKRVPTLQEATVRWLDQYQKGRFEVYVDTSALAKEVDKLGSVMRLAVIGIVLTGMIIGSAIAGFVTATLSVTVGIPRFVIQLTYFGYVFSMIVATLIVIRLVWRWIRGESSTFD